MTDIEPDRVIEARGLTKLYGNHRAMLPAQMRGAILGAPLPFDQSLLLIWRQITGLIADMIVVFAAAYVVFQREEIRA